MATEKSDHERPTYKGNITPAVAAYLEYRSQQFQVATSGKGAPLTYGAIKKER